MESVLKIDGISRVSSSVRHRSSWDTYAGTSAARTTAATSADTSDPKRIPADVAPMAIATRRSAHASDLPRCSDLLASLFESSSAVTLHDRLDRSTSTSRRRPSLASKARKRRRAPRSSREVTIAVGTPPSCHAPRDRGVPSCVICLAHRASLEHVSSEKGVEQGGLACTRLAEHDCHDALGHETAHRVDPERHAARRRRVRYAISLVSVGTLCLGGREHAARALSEHVANRRHVTCKHLVRRPVGFGEHHRHVRAAVARDHGRTGHATRRIARPTPNLP